MYAVSMSLLFNENSPWNELHNNVKWFHNSKFDDYKEHIFILSNSFET